MSYGVFLILFMDEITLNWIPFKGMDTFFSVDFPQRKV